MATKILNRLYLGDAEDASLTYGKEDWITINVLEHETEQLLENIYIPILKHEGMNWWVDWDEVIRATDAIEENLFKNRTKKILLHCGAGQERSPLVMQYYLMRYYDMGADKAFEYIKERRPGVLRCDKNYKW